MAQSPIDICNLALGIFGDSRIQSFSERSKEAAACANYYNQALDEALEAYDWPFARTYALAVAPADTALSPGYAYTYGFPSDAIALRGIARTMKSEPSTEYTLSTVRAADGAIHRLIHTDKTGGVLVYTRRETHVPLFSPLFVAAVAAKLAQYIAMPLTKDKSKRDDAEKQFDKLIEAAAVSVANQGQAGLAGNVMPDWIEARG